MSSDYITIPKDATLSQMGYYIDYDVSEADDTIAYIRYYIGNHFLGKATLMLNTQTDKVMELLPDKQNETATDVMSDELPINIWWILGGVVAVIGVVVIGIMFQKTKIKRKIKKERKKLFK